MYNLRSKLYEVLAEEEQDAAVQSKSSTKGSAHVQLIPAYPEVTPDSATFSFVWTGHEAWDRASIHHQARLPS